MNSTLSVEPCSVPGCGKPAQMFVNITANCASTVPATMRPFCDKHNPLLLQMTSLQVVSEWWDRQHKST